MIKIYSVIAGTGSYIPSNRVANEDFIGNSFYGSDGKLLDSSNRNIIDKFLEITTIEERRYVTDNLKASDIAHLAALDAIESSGVDRETLDYIIVAHNFGDVAAGSNRVDMVPSLGARVKHLLKIKNPNTVAYDIIFGCPGWVQAVIQADYFIKSGDAKRVLVVGVDVLSRVSDPHDRDSMLYADGAGATIFEGKESDTPIGILAHKTRTDSLLYSQMLHVGPSYNPELKEGGDTFIKMNGRRLYQYALDTVPTTVKECIEKSNTPFSDIKKVLIHQANGKMDDAILKRLFTLYGIDEVPEDIMPMTIAKLGNSSVATVPTLLDLILKSKMEGHAIEKGDTVVLASVGAGMSINAVVYKM